MLSPLYISILSIVLIAIVLNQVKPKLVFKEDGNFKTFGIGKDKTIIPFWLAITLFGLLIYLISFNKKD